MALVQEVQREDDLQVVQLVGQEALALVWLSKKPGIAMHREVEISMTLWSSGLQEVQNPF